MSEKQPEALQLAEYLWNGSDQFNREAADELRRQHALLLAKDALLEEMAGAIRWVKLIFSDDTFAQERDPELWLPEFDAVLAKWEASK